MGAYFAAKGQQAMTDRAARWLDRDAEKPLCVGRPMMARFGRATRYGRHF
jgi:hypothetical protein